MEPVAEGRTAATPVLEVDGLEVVYDQILTALTQIEITIADGEIVALLGANGAGKTTLLRSLTGLLAFHGASVTAGAIRLWGDDITHSGPAGIVQRGVAQVMEGRRVFAELSVDENLSAGAISVKSRTEVERGRERAFELFPRLGERRQSQAGYLSGGEQQMLAIGRALMSSPRLLLLDEPSLGLAPLVVERIRDVIADVNHAGTTVLLIEQNASMALAIADRAYVLETGRVVRSGTSDELRRDEEIAALYLGLSRDGSRDSYRETYARRRAPTTEPAP